MGHTDYEIFWGLGPHNKILFNSRSDENNDFPFDRRRDKLHKKIDHLSRPSDRTDQNRQIPTATPMRQDNWDNGSGQDTGTRW